MVTLLSRIFIQDADQYHKPEVRRMYGIVCSVFGILLNIVLFGFKFFAGFMTGSVAITADAFNNLSDAGSSLITLVGFKFAGMKPDNEHPFGHGRIEYISGLIVAMLIVLMGFELAQSSMRKIFYPEKVDMSIAAIVILAVSILVKLYMAFYNFMIGNKISSATMKATALDSLSDAISTTVVLASTGIMIVTHINMDAYCGILVALFILWAGYQAAKETISPLLGAKPEQEFVDRIEEIVMAQENVIGIHDLVVHDYGPGRVMISLHAEVPGDEDIFELHDMIDNTEYLLGKELGCEAVIHMDPIESKNEVVVAMRKNVSDIVKEIDAELTIHDFRMVSGDTHTNLIFDVVVPQEFSMTDEEVKEEVQKRVFEKYPNNFSVIKVDKTYI